MSYSKTHMVELFTEIEGLFLLTGFNLFQVCLTKVKEVPAAISSALAFPVLCGTPRHQDGMLHYIAVLLFISQMQLGQANYFCMTLDPYGEIHKYDPGARNLTGCPLTCHCSKTEHLLYIQNCKIDPISELPKFLLLHLDIVGLTIQTSHLSTLPCMIANFKFLKFLNLQENAIRDLPWECLQKIPQLCNLDLSGNQIEVLRNGSLYDFPGLTGIVLNNNRISVIETDVFRLPKRFNFPFNIYLRKNNLTSLDSWPMRFSKSFTMDFRDNSISKLTNLLGGDTTVCPDSIIHLSGNKITHFTDVLKNWRANLTSKKAMNVCLNHIYISRNPLICDCKDYNVYVRIHGSDKKRYKEVKCNLPLNLKGQRVVSISLEQFICIDKESCPIGCICFETPFYRNVAVSCNNKYNMKKLPNVIPSLPQTNYMYFLNFTRSNLEELSFQPYLWNMSVGVFSHSLIRRVTFDALNAMSNMFKLYLDNNLLQRLPNLSNIQFKANAELYLSFNPWVCDCEALETRDWIVLHRGIVKDTDNIVCHSPSHMAKRKMTTLDQALFCPSNSLTNYIIIASVAVSVPLIFFFSACLISKRKIWIYKRTGWHPLNRDEAADEGKEFDVFVSYADEDEEYVGEYLIPELQNLGFKVCYHRVNFHAGKPITTNIFEAIDGSKRTLIFFSNAFKQSDFCMWEFSVALEMDLKEGTNRLITIKDTDLDIETLDVTPRSYFKRSTYIEREAVDFWENLMYSLPIERMGNHVGPPQPIGEEE